MLFQVLGHPDSLIYVIGHNQVWTKVLFDKTSSMLNALGFDHKPIISERTIINFGKTIKFVTRDQYSMMTKLPPHIAFLDEK
jgi:hypothetical protein